MEEFNSGNLEESGQELPQSENSDKKKKGEKTPFAYDFVSMICTAVCIIAIVFTFFYRYVGVVGESMLPTLNPDDGLLVATVNTSFERGDIIISGQPNAFNEPIVKRVIATGGQVVDIDFVAGRVFVDGEEIQEDYIASRTTDAEGISFPFEVKKGQLFVMGDNRGNSTDSRSPEIGTIDERYVIGKVRFRVSPIKNFKIFN